MCKSTIFQVVLVSSLTLINASPSKRILPFLVIWLLHILQELLGYASHHQHIFPLAQACCLISRDWLHPHLCWHHHTEWLWVQLISCCSISHHFLTNLGAFTTTPVTLLDPVSILTTAVTVQMLCSTVVLARGKFPYSCHTYVVCYSVSVDEGLLCLSWAVLTFI